MKTSNFKVVADARRATQGQFSHYHQVMARSSGTGKAHGGGTSGENKNPAPPKLQPHK